MMRSILFEPAPPAASGTAISPDGGRLAWRRAQEREFFQDNLFQVIDNPRPDPPRRPAAESQIPVGLRENRVSFPGRQTAGPSRDSELPVQLGRPPMKHGENKLAKSGDSKPVFSPGMSSADRYWASQPEPVRALRFAKPEEREAMAQQLSKQGYAIDAPIMVWGWDPEQTMRLRQDYGYTWVPSAFQPQIPVAPGLAFPGTPSYDPNQIPPGSIPVSLDFLKV